MTAWDDIRFEWARGPFRLSTEDSLVVMARIADLERRKTSDDLAYEHVAEMCNEQLNDIRELESEVANLRSAAERALAEIDNSCWYDAEAILSDALARCAPSATAGAPVSETHTDPKEAPQ